MKRTPLSLLVFLAAAVPAVRAVDFIKAQNADPLNSATAWTNNAVPTSGDVLLWNSIYTTPGLIATFSPLGGDMSVSGIRVTNVGGTRNQTNLAYVGFANAGSANTLTIGAGGINLGTATQALRTQSKIMLNADQAWVIGNANTASNPMAFNNGEDVGFEALADGAPFNFGGKTVTVSGAGAVTITSGFTVSNGTLTIGNPYFVIQGGGNRPTTMDATLNANINTGGKLHLQCNSGALVSAATINLNGGTLTFCNNSATTTVTHSGPVNVLAPSTITVSKTFNNTGNTSPLTFSGNLTGSAALTINNDQPTIVNRLLISGNNSAYSGTVTLTGLAGKATRMTSATAGSAAATWNVNTGHTLELEGPGVELGTLNGAGNVTMSAAGSSTITAGAGNFTGALTNGAGTLALTKTGPGTLTLSGAGNYTGPTLVNGGSLITSTAQTAAGTVTVADGATFGVTVASPGTTFASSSVTAGAATGATLQFNTGTAGNPSVSVMNVTTFNPAAPTQIKVTGTNYTTNVPFTLIDYAGAIGGVGFAGLNLSLPFRVAGSLVDNVGNSSVDLIVTGFASPIWRGSVNNNWDIDSVGDGSTGTANWFSTSGPSTYVQAPAITDAVIFNDSLGAGPSNVNLTTTVSPTSVTVNNSAVNYTFSGTGKISGSGPLAKTGTGSLTLANTAVYDYTGTTTISAGTLLLGDGATSGAGAIAGSIVNDAVLVLNRPDNFAFSNTLTGSGTLRKDQTNTANVPVAVTWGMPITANAGILRFDAGGTLSGVLSGAGELRAGGGTLIIAGNGTSTMTGPISVTTGLLQLSSTGASTAGNINISGTGQLSLTVSDQLSDTATINFTGTSTDSIPTQTGTETVGNVIVNSATGGTAGGQVIMRNNFTVANTATVQRGILGVASAHTGNVNAINITSAPGNSGIVRIAGSSAASTLNVGAGGITASGGEIQVKFNTNAFDATLNLGGNFTATGNVIFTNGGYNTGANLNLINLTGNRTFNIAGSTTTTVNPDISGPGGLIKDGPGVLYLNANCAGTYTGDTVLNLGILRLDGTLTGTNIISNGAGLAGIGTITTGAQGVVLNSGGFFTPGTSGAAGTLTIVAAGSELNVIGTATPANGGLLYCDLDTPASSDRVVLAAGTLNIGNGLLGIDDININPLAGFGPGTYTLIETGSPITGTLAANVSTTVGAFTATLAKGDSDTDLVLNVTSGQTGLQAWRQTHFGSPDNTGNGANNADPDNDGLQNLVEFLFGTVPVSSTSTQALIPGSDAANFTLTYSRAKAALTDVDAIAEASTDLTTWSTAGVSEIILSDDGTTQVVKVSIAKSAAHRFLHIKAVQK